MTAADSELGLGTVQWGAPYGVANRTGVPTKAEISRMLALAEAASVRTLDTARAYGDSEAVIGELAPPSFRIFTKLDPIVWTPGTTAEVAAERTQSSVETSRKLLRRDRLDALLLHRAAHRYAEGGAVWDALLELRRRGAIDRLGVSVGTPEEAMELVDDPDVSVLQVAASAVDRRLETRGFFDRARRNGVLVVVRSVFLQGALLLQAEQLPPHLAGLAAAVRAIAETARAHGVSPAAVLLGYARKLGAATLLVGCETAAQLESNLADFSRAAATFQGPLPDLAEALLDPARWSVPPA